MNTVKKHFYNFGGIQRDLNPFLMQDSDLMLSLNWYSNQGGVKKVRPGYKKFLDTPDSSPVRNLIYYNLPSYKGLIRVSNEKMYINDLYSSVWGPSVKSLGIDAKIGYAKLDGQVPYLHFSDKTDGYFTYDGATFKPWTGQYTPKASFLAAWNSRVFTDFNLNSLAESAIQFDQTMLLVIGTVNVTNGSTALVGVNTAFTTDLNTTMALSINDVIYNISSITDDTNLVLQTSYAGTTATGLTIYKGYAADPFYLNPNDPSGGGTVSINAGDDGQIVGLTKSNDRINIYKQFGIMRYNGSDFMEIPFVGNILAYCTNRSRQDYILSTTGIWLNDGSKTTPVDDGIKNVWLDTMRTWGIGDPVMYSFDEFTIIYIGKMRIGRGDGTIDIEHGCFVKNDDYQEWDIWDLGHQMTSFGTYYNPDSGQPSLISGDVNGNTYIWGEQYSLDDTIPVAYNLRSCYHTMGDPAKSKFPDESRFSVINGANAVISAAIDFSDQYIYDQNYINSYLKKYRLKGMAQFKTISIEIKGSTTTSRPELYGYTLGYKDVADNEDRREGGKSSATASRR